VKYSTRGEKKGVYNTTQEVEEKRGRRMERSNWDCRSLRSVDYVPGDERRFM
jgi:hypothetical protein